MNGSTERVIVLVVLYDAYLWVGREFLAELAKALAFNPSPLIMLLIAGVMLAPFGLVGIAREIIKDGWRGG